MIFDLIKINFKDYTEGELANALYKFYDSYEIDAFGFYDLEGEELWKRFEIVKKTLNNRKSISAEKIYFLSKDEVNLETVFLCKNYGFSLGIEYVNEWNINNVKQNIKYALENHLNIFILVENNNTSKEFANFIFNENTNLIDNKNLKIVSYISKGEKFFDIRFNKFDLGISELKTKTLNNIKETIELEDVKDIDFGPFNNRFRRMTNLDFEKFVNYEENIPFKDKYLVNIKNNSDNINEFLLGYIMDETYYLILERIGNEINLFVLKMQDSKAKDFLITSKVFMEKMLEKFDIITLSANKTNTLGIRILNYFINKGIAELKYEDEEIIKIEGKIK